MAGFGEVAVELGGNMVRAGVKPGKAPSQTVVGEGVGSVEPPRHAELLYVPETAHLWSA